MPITRFRAAVVCLLSVAASCRHSPPKTPIDVPPGTRLLFEAKGEGVQIYTCTQAQDGPKWILKAPDAQLLDAQGKVIGAHFAGPTWKLADGGQVQGEVIASVPSPNADAVAWLLLRAKPGTAAGSMDSVAFIRRTDTHGGVALKTGCQNPDDLGETIRAPYSATYSFFGLK
jgi:hypothetical protein